LPGTRDEVERVARLFDDGPDKTGVCIRSGAHATKSEFAKIASGERTYRYLHIATHGLVDAEKPQLSGLLFSPGEHNDPFLHTFEIFNAHLPCELVVLSACQTGLGRLLGGEGLIGLTRAFNYAGCPRVCVSLWNVVDMSTPALMESFYRRLLDGSSPALALREAQLQMLNDEWPHPYFWAPFIISGT
jgi:CHAT domain-containing protein